jgi:hypothetical protein
VVARQTSSSRFSFSRNSCTGTPQRVTSRGQACMHARMHARERGHSTRMPLGCRTWGVVWVEKLSHGQGAAHLLEQISVGLPRADLIRGASSPLDAPRSPCLRLAQNEPGVTTVKKGAMTG